MIFRYAKFGFFVLMAVAFYLLAFLFPQYAFPRGGDQLFEKLLILLVLNYAFFKMVLYYISYYNDLIIFR
jgi:hypothetical protein